MRSFAKRLVDSEGHSNTSSAAQTAVAFPVADKLRPQLAMLMGQDGVKALLSRSLVLATTEVSWLGAVQINADGDLEWVEALGSQPNAAEFLEGRVVLLAQLIGLLVAFIGPGLTSSLVGEIWPQIPLYEQGFGKKVNSEETN